MLNTILLLLVCVTHIGCKHFSGVSLKSQFCTYNNSKIETYAVFVIILLGCGVPSLYFYIKCRQGLMAMKSNQKRNKTLTLIMAISFLSWILCWLPKIAFALHPRKQTDSGIETLSLRILVYVENIPRQIYPVFNPIFIVLTYKPLLDSISPYWNKIKQKLLMERINSGRDGNKAPQHRIALVLKLGFLAAVTTFVFADLCRHNDCHYGKRSMENCFICSEHETFLESV